MNFKNIATVMAVISFLLGIGYIFFGTIVINRWEIEPTNEVLLFGRRLGSLNIGLSIIFYFSRNLPLSGTRTVLSAGAAITLSILVLLGVYEYSSGNVGPGILISIVIEFLLALGYVIILFKDRKILVKENLTGMKSDI